MRILFLRVLIPVLCLLLCGLTSALAQSFKSTRKPLVRVVDLNVGQKQQVTLATGKTVEVRLVDLKEHRDVIRGAVRRAEVTVEVNGKSTTIVSATYHLPKTIAGVQIDCPITKGYYLNTVQDSWGLDKDARLRLWPADSPLVARGTFVYPVKQRWFASDTQMANVPVFVDGGEIPTRRSIYYHSGLDIGGAEGMVEVVAATGGIVVATGEAVLPDYKDDLPFQNAYDDVFVVDDRGWYYRYTHLKSIDAALAPGRMVKPGQRIGILGKEGGSGGWAHLHFEIKARQPSGKWGTQAGYAFLWNAYLREHRSALLAVARPHRMAFVGQEVELDGSRSYSADKITAYDWTFWDGDTATGPMVKRAYDRPGTYSEVLKITDAQGRVDYDFAVVQVLDRKRLDRLPPTIHAAFSPTIGISPGDPVTFKVRTFRTTDGRERWDFGDGSPPVHVRSDVRAKHDPNGYAQTVHRFEKPGDYLVHVERTGANGYTAITHLHVPVGEPPSQSAAGKN